MWGIMFYPCIRIPIKQPGFNGKYFKVLWIGLHRAKTKSLGLGVSEFFVSFRVPELSFAGVVSPPKNATKEWVVGDRDRDEG